MTNILLHYFVSCFQMSKVATPYFCLKQVLYKHSSYTFPLFIGCFYFTGKGKYFVNCVETENISV